MRFSVPRYQQVVSFFSVWFYCPLFLDLLDKKEDKYQDVSINPVQNLVVFTAVTSRLTLFHKKFSDFLLQSSLLIFELNGVGSVDETALI